MSTRALKKLEETTKVSDDLSVSHNHESFSDDNQPDNDANRFLMLDEDDEVDGVAAEAGAEFVNGDAKLTSVPENKKRRRKRKKKAKKNEDVDDIVSDIVNDDVNARPMPDDDITKSDWLSNYLSESELFYIEHRNLTPENELRRKLGTKAVDSESNSSSRNRNRRRGVMYSRLVQPATNWPVYGKSGLSMKQVESHAGGVSSYSFEHLPAYQKAQFAFWEAVESMNPDAFVAILAENPYHVDTLLQLSEVMRSNEDYQAARDLVARALYGCECAFHPLFSISQNTSRLDYSQAENRPFFIALLRHMMSIAQRGCNRTALEFCKFIYSLSPNDDPLGMLLLLDFLAIRSMEYEYLYNLYNVLEISRNLSQLPNFCYSVALALHLRAQQQLSSGAVSEELETEACSLLQEAILKFPTVLNPMLDRMNVEPDKAVSSHRLFSSVEQTNDASGLRLLISIFVARNYVIWKEPEILHWLEANVHATIERYNNEEDCRALVEEWRSLRKTRYVGTPRNILRHVVMSELKEAMADLPQEMRDRPIMQYDPLPPMDSRRNYELPERRNRRANDSYLSAFFRSILPNFNPETDLFMDERADEIEGAAGGDQAGEFQRSVNRLMDAVRDLIGNIEPPEIPREDGHRNDDLPNNDHEWDLD